MDKNTKMFTFGILVLVSLVFAILPLIIGYAVGPFGSFVFALVAVIFAILAFSVKYYDYLVLSFVHMKKGTAVVSSDDPFYMAPNGNAVVVRGETLVYASAFVRIPIYESASEMQPEDKFEFASLFAKVATISKTPMKLSVQLYIINKDDYIRKITDKLNQVQEVYNQLSNQPGTPADKTERINGEVTMWHNLYDSVNKTRSQTLAAYAMVSAVGGTEEEAINIAVIRAEEIAAGISSVLGITASVAREEEILVMLEPDHMIPSRTVDEMMQYKSSEQTTV
ncbi:MAG: hypothetical protein KGH72_01785 [Candidatus Micrarchaeota archaeon]|nr:hypothetical protein [Candidatus Micrarchaeota archaeon]